MSEKDIISFKEFLGKSLSSKSLEILSKIDFDDVDNNIEEESNFSENNDEIVNENDEVISKMEDVVNEDLLNDDSYRQEYQEKVETEYYTLYSDKNENFICDIHIEGADPEKSQARLIIESDDWNLMIEGEIRDGKCIIPVKSLRMLEDGQVGKIKLEVIAEGSVVSPWEKMYKVKKSKNVSVRVNL